MRNLRYWLAALCIWLAILYNLERWNEPINIASFFYVYVLIIVVAILITSWPQKQRRRWLFLACLLPYLLLKIYFGYPLGNQFLPITITEIAALFVTIVLTCNVATYASVLQEAVIELTTNHLYRGTYSFDVGQGEIYREIRRARRYERPATLLAISPTISSQKLSHNRFSKEMQEELVKRYVGGQIVRMLKEELPDCDVIAQRNDHLIVLLPEIDRQTSDDVVNCLRIAARENLGLEFAIGVSSFPDQAVTFESLLEQAESGMKDAARPGSSYDSALFDRPQKLDQVASTD